MPRPAAVGISRGGLPRATGAFLQTAWTTAALPAGRRTQPEPSAYKGWMQPADTPRNDPRRLAKRRYGTGSVFQKRNAWYGQWRVRDRIASRKLGPVRVPGSRDGLTKTMAEARLRKLMGEVALPPVAERITSPRRASG
jgi:hypothetical protein